MSQTAIRKVELNRITPCNARVLKETLAYFREVCAYLMVVVKERWPEISEYSTSKDKLTFVEGLVHSTKTNDALYSEFDKRFYKLPSYYLRAAINYCIGQYSSYVTRMAEYEEERYKAISKGKKFRKNPPKLNMTPNACPSLYRKNTFLMEGNVILIKVRYKHDWVWIRLTIPMRDFKDLKRACTKGELLCPELSYKNHKFYLSFPIKYEVKDFSDTTLENQKVLGVDLGLNNGAVCSIIDANGTVYGRFFDPFSYEKDRINHMLNKIRKLCKQSGKGQAPTWAYTKLEGMKDNYIKQLSRWIVNLAIQYGCYGIVLEHLDIKTGKKNIRQRLHNWCTCKMRDYIKGMAFREGIRTFQICPKNTSALAYDGSGRVIRDENNYSMCTFANGKRYNCDLSASYNIGARYFIRAYKKSMDENSWSQLTAKVPELAKGTTGTLATLRSLSAMLKVSA